MYKKRVIAIFIAVLMCVGQLDVVYASAGESGYFGGISTGIMLPKTITEKVPNKRKNKVKLDYIEVIFITGEPIKVSGTIEIDKDESDIEDNESGILKEKYLIKAISEDNRVKLNRSVEIQTSFVKYESDTSIQIKRDLSVTKWKEKIDVDGTVYEVDEDLSKFDTGQNIASFIEDRTPGISYYNGNMSYKLIYNVDDQPKVEVISEGDTYGFQEPWSKAENQSIMLNIDCKGEDGWQMGVEIKPFNNSKKTLYYSKANPLPISFAGTYTQKFETEGGLTYEILTNNKRLTEKQKKGSAYLKTQNDFEKLRIPTNFQYVDDGHFAKEDICKLMSMEIFEYSPISFQPYEAISRGDFIKALCKAVNIKPKETRTTRSRKQPKPIIFTDVQPEHPLYEWILQAYNYKLIKGTGQSRFNPERTLNREEAFTLLVRVLGLERLGTNPTIVTKFLDDDDISNWAKNAIYAGNRLGLIQGYPDGHLYPKRPVSKAEAAMLINNLIEYLRTDMINSYKRL